jgi:hypothetical protein
MRRTRQQQQRLRLHRETMRVLSSSALARVAGGTRTIDVEETTTLGDPAPKTNAWSIIDLAVPEVICGVVG